MKRSLVVTLAGLALAASVVTWRPGTPADSGRVVPAPAMANKRAVTPQPAEPVTVPAVAADRHRQLALAIASALVSADPMRRETALHQLLPELLAGDAGRAVELHAGQSTGEARNALREALSRQWVSRDPAAALAWLRTLEGAERRAGAVDMTRALAAHDPATAIEVALEFGVGSDDGSLEHLVQIWAVADPPSALRWLQSRSDRAELAALQTRIESVLSPRVAVHE